MEFESYSLPKAYGRALKMIGQFFFNTFVEIFCIAAGVTLALWPLSYNKTLTDLVMKTVRDDFSPVLRGLFLEVTKLVRYLRTGEGRETALPEAQKVGATLKITFKFQGAQYHQHLPFDDAKFRNGRREYLGVTHQDEEMPLRHLNGLPFLVDASDLELKDLKIREEELLDF